MHISGWILQETCNTFEWSDKILEKNLIFKDPAKHKIPEMLNDLHYLHLCTIYSCMYMSDQGYFNYSFDILEGSYLEGSFAGLWISWRFFEGFLQDSSLRVTIWHLVTSWPFPLNFMSSQRWHRAGIPRSPHNLKFKIFL